MYKKYPRTPHLPFSPGVSDDDKVLPDTNCFAGKEVVVTEKLDGECTTMYCDHIHARSLDSLHHPSRAWVKQLHGLICKDIPPKFRICGENLYAKHSIHYSNLPSYFFVFGIYNDQGICLSWDETLEWCSLLDLVVAPELYRGIWDEAKIKSIWSGKSVYGGDGEGYVVRACESFNYEDFAKHVAKWVRASHITTSEHWMQQAVVKNLLSPKGCFTTEKPVVE